MYQILKSKSSCNLFSIYFVKLSLQSSSHLWLEPGLILVMWLESTVVPWIQLLLCVWDQICALSDGRAGLALTTTSDVSDGSKLHTDSCLPTRTVCCVSYERWLQTRKWKQICWWVQPSVDMLLFTTVTAGFIQPDTRISFGKQSESAACQWGWAVFLCCSLT